MIDEKALKEAFTKVKNDLQSINSKIRRVSDNNSKMIYSINESFRLIREDIKEIGKRVDDVKTFERKFKEQNTEFEKKLEEQEQRFEKKLKELGKRASTETFKDSRVSKKLRKNDLEKDEFWEKDKEKLLGKILKEEPLFESLPKEKAFEEKPSEVHSYYEPIEKPKKKSWIKGKFEKVVDFLAEEDE